jgi:putative methyltransferase (TIGR04325 family)
VQPRRPVSASALREWLPPRLHRALGRALGRTLRFDGGHADWSSAAAAARGYDDAAILQRVRDATREVVAGRAAYERDSVLFDHWQPPFALLAPLLRHALAHGGRLDVADFGGSLGSSYRQCRPFLPRLDVLQWHVVEQPAFAAAGRAEFSTAELHFHERLADLPPALAPRLLMACSVLQYLPQPAQAIDEWTASDAQTLLLDRTPMWDGNADRACVQQAPRHIYDSSYPCWVLSRPQLFGRLERGWRLVCEFDSPEGRHTARGGPSFEFKGQLWERQPR